jgi:NDP-sugar pyrophosphorylase family protein
MQAVVLAGGLATRMRPHTLAMPKSMLVVAGRPFVDWQLERLADCGFRDVVMCIAHLGEQIRDHVGDGSRHGLSVAWSEDGGKLLGTAGALRAALHLLAPTFLVTYGDSYLPFDYAEPLRILQAKGDCDGVMAVYKNDGKWDTSNVVTDGVWVTCYDKSAGSSAARERTITRSKSAGSSEARERTITRSKSAGSSEARERTITRSKTKSAQGAFDHIDYGATALRREVIGALAPGQPHGLDVLGRDLADRRRLRACVARDRFFEIGSPEGLAELDQKLRTSDRT